jgi:hypothetical protein
MQRWSECVAVCGTDDSADDQNAVPAARELHSSIALDGATLVVFGGHDGRTALADLWVAEFSDGAAGGIAVSWRRPRIVSGSPPPPRVRAALEVEQGGGAVLVCGGVDLELGVEYDDLYRATLRGGSVQWELIYRGVPHASPARRALLSAASAAAATATGPREVPRPAEATAGSGVRLAFCGPVVMKLRGVCDGTEPPVRCRRALRAAAARRPHGCCICI